MQEEVGTTFREVQSFRQWWVWLIVCGVAIFAWYGFVQQIVVGQPFGSNPAPDWAMWLILVLFGIGLPLLFLRMELVVKVSEDAVQIHFAPFVSRRIPFQEIEHLSSRTYSPILEYGGWGIRGWGWSQRAYNVSGNRGVELALSDGGTVMIGSQRSDELALAIADALASRKASS